MVYRMMVWFVLTGICLACSREEKPTGILTEGEMVQVLMNMYLAEERFSRLSVSYDSSVKLMPYFQQRVFSQTGIADTTYRKSMEYYMANPKKLEFIYTALIDSLNLREQRRPEEQTSGNAISQ